MAFPIVQSVTQYRNGFEFSTGGTNHAWTLPAGINAGDLLIAYFAPRQTLTTPPPGWAELHSSPYHYHYVYFKVADGTESGTNITWIVSASSNSCGNLYRITNYTGTPESAQSASDNPPSLTPSWGAADTLWIAEVNNVVGNRRTTAAPANYGNLSTNWANTALATDTHLSTADRSLNATSEDPGTFTFNSSTGNKSSTVAVQGTPPSIDTDLFDAEFLSYITYMLMRALTYSVESTQAVTKSLTYEIYPTKVTTRPLEYGVAVTPSIQKSVTYTVETTVPVTKSATYVVEVSSVTQKATQYAVISASSETRGLEYIISNERLQTVDVTYSVLTTSSVTKNLSYYTIESGVINKTSEYTVLVVGTLQRGITYEVITTSTDTRDSEYRVLLTQVSTRDVAYAVKLAVVAQRSVDYEVTAEVSIQLPAKYGVLTTSSTTRDLEFRVSPSYSETRTLQYKLNYSPTRPEDLPRGSVFVRRFEGSATRMNRMTGTATQPKMHGSSKHVNPGSQGGYARGRV